MVMAGAELVELNQIHGFHVFDAIPFAPFQPILWAVLPSAASTACGPHFENPCIRACKVTPRKHTIALPLPVNFSYFLGFISALHSTIWNRLIYGSQHINIHAVSNSKHCEQNLYSLTQRNVAIMECHSLTRRNQTTCYLHVKMWSPLSFFVANSFLALWGSVLDISHEVNSNG